MDADKEGFLRDNRSLIQTIGRAARNSNGKVIMYADRVTGSMQTAIDETQRRRAIQIEYNTKHGITPTTILKSNEAIMEQTSIADFKAVPKSYYVEPEVANVAADPVVAFMNKPQLEKMVAEAKANMEKAASELNFLQAARYRDEMLQLQERISKMS